MRIISNYHDYYDCMQRQAQDRSITFVRNREEIHFDENKGKEMIKKLPYAFCSHNRRLDFHNGSVSFFVLGFCGDLIPGVEVSFHSPGSYVGNDKSEILWPQYCPKEVMDKLKEASEKKFKKGYLHYDQSHIYSMVHWWLSHMEYRDYFSQYFERKEDVKVSDFRSWFLKYKIPIFTIGWPENHITLYPCLKDIRVFTFITAAQCFQRIQQFIINDLAIQKDGSEFPVPEKDRLIGHGFDPKWSFRKEPKSKTV